MMQKQRFFPGLLILMVLIVFLSGACSRKVIYQSQWQPAAIAPETIPLHWEASAGEDPSGILSYGISNDRDNLYVFLKAADRTTQLKMLRSGVQLDFDTLGRDGSHMLLRYPYYGEGMNASQAARLPLPGRPGTRSHAVNAVLKEHTTIFTAGFPGMANGPSENVHSEGIMVRMQMDEADNMYYWAVIPLRFFPAALAASPEAGLLSVGVSVLGIDMGQEMDDGPQGSGLYRPVPGRRDETVVGWPGDRQGSGSGGPGRAASIDVLQRTQTFRTVFRLSAGG